MRALERALNFYGLSSQATSNQLSVYLMEKVETFHENASEEQAVPLKAASVVGLQPIPELDEACNDSQQPACPRVWVLNSKVHLDDRGKEVKPSPFIWLGNYSSGKPTPFIAPQSLAASVKPPVLERPGKEALSRLIDAICRCFTTNAEAAFLTLGAEVGVQICIYFACAIMYHCQ